MNDFSLLAPLLLSIGGLIIGALLKSILKKSRFPYTVGLFLIGILVGITNRADWFSFSSELSQSIESVANINPDIILYVFLPILIFDAAYEMNLHIFKKTLANATLLAGPGLVICMLLTGILMMGIAYFAPEYSNWTWTFALMFGGLISATDPVAVVALLQELKTSKRFSTLVDGESLLNDGTGIVCFMLFFSPFIASGSNNSSPFFEFIKVIAISCILGYFIARLCIWFITRINSEEMIQNSVIILSSYITFILSQYYLGVSGVIALVAFGLTITYVGRPRLKPQVNYFMGKFWELLTYIANTLIFIIVGIVIAEKVHFTWSSLWVLLAVYVGLNLIRFLMIMFLYPIMKHLGYGLSARESVILTWGGLRGALGMTLALMVSYTPSIPEEIRTQILFLTAGIVTLTLSVNATTSSWLLQKLGLIQKPSAKSMVEKNVEATIYEASEKYLEKLYKRESLNGANWDRVRTYLPSYQEASFSPEEKAIMAEVRLRILDHEKALCMQIYDEGIISQLTFRKLMNSLDELYDHDGTYPLNHRDSIFNACRIPSVMSSMSKYPFLVDYLSFYWREKITMIYDLARGFIIVQKENLKQLDEWEHSNLLTTEQKSYLAPLRMGTNQNIDKMEVIINNLSDQYPKAYHHALTQKSIRMLLSNERRIVRQMAANGLISDKDMESRLAAIDERADKVNAFSHTIMASFLRWIFFIRRKK